MKFTANWNPWQKEVFRYLSTILLFVIVGLVTIIVMFIIAAIISCNDQFNQTAEPIQPAYEQLKKQYNNEIVLSCATFEGAYNYDFKYTGKLKKQISDGQNLCEISEIAYSCIADYIESSSQPERYKYRFHISFASEQNSVDFCLDRESGSPKLTVSTNQAINPECLSKLKHLISVEVIRKSYKENDLSELQNWCNKNNIDLSFYERNYG